MAFSWNPLPKVGHDVTFEKIEEIRDNVDTLCDNISISRPIWETLKRFEPIETDLEDQINRVDDNNYCRAENSSNFLSYLNNDDTVIYITHDSPWCPNADSSLNGVQYSTMQGSNLAAYCTSNNSPIYNAQLSIVNSPN